MKTIILAICALVVITSSCGPAREDPKDADMTDARDERIPITVTYDAGYIDYLSEMKGLSQDSARSRVNRVVQEVIDLMTSGNRVALTDPIDIAPARQYHEHYWNNKPQGESLRGVLIELKDILPDMMNEILSNNLSTADAIMYAYLIKYVKDITVNNKPYKANQTSILVQLGRYRNLPGGQRDTSMYVDKIYDYGDLCPPRCPKAGDAVYGD